MSTSMQVEHKEVLANAHKGKVEEPITAAQMRKQGINVCLCSLWTCADSDAGLLPADYEEIYIHAKVSIVDDAAFTIGSANLNLRSMALDSELNVLSDAKEVAYQLRADLFTQCTQNAGPHQFGDMEETFEYWQIRQEDNDNRKKKGMRLKSQLMSFYVSRKPGAVLI